MNQTLKETVKYPVLTYEQLRFLLFVIGGMSGRDADAFLDVALKNSVYDPNQVQQAKKVRIDQVYRTLKDYMPEVFK